MLVYLVDTQQLEQEIKTKFQALLKPVTNVDLLGCYVEAGAGDENETPSFVETWNKWRSPCPKSSYRCIETESSKSATLRLPLYTHVLRTVDCARQYWTAKIKDKRRCTTISSLPRQKCNAGVLKSDVLHSFTCMLSSIICDTIVFHSFVASCPFTSTQKRLEYDLKLGKRQKFCIC